MSDRRDYSQIVDALLEGLKPHIQEVIEKKVNGSIRDLDTKVEDKFKELNDRMDLQDIVLGKLDPVSEALTVFQVIIKFLKYIGVPTTAIVGLYYWLIAK